MSPTFKSLGSDSSVAVLQYPVLPEDQARANFYALLARLYATGPDAALLHAIASAPPLDVAQSEAEDEDATSDFAAAWTALAVASAHTEAEAAAQEYDELFV